MEKSFYWIYLSQCLVFEGWLSILFVLIDNYYYFYLFIEIKCLDIYRILFDWKKFFFL